MSGDGTNDIEIPAVFMQKIDAAYLQELMKIEDNIFILLTGLPDGHDRDEDEDVRSDGVRGVESEGVTGVEDDETYNSQDIVRKPKTGTEYHKRNENIKKLELDPNEQDFDSRTEYSQDRTNGNNNNN